MRPSDFDQSQADRWDEWVLEHGLPDVVGHGLPVGHSVPISVWLGPSTAAVMHLHRRWDDDDLPGTASFVESDISLFVRDGARWVAAGGGGSGGDDVAVLRRENLAPREVMDIEAETMSAVGADWVTAASGRAGTAARTVEVEQDGVVVQRPIEAPLGWFVVSANGRVFTVRVRDATGEGLGEQLVDVAERFGAMEFRRGDGSN